MKLPSRRATATLAAIAAATGTFVITANPFAGAATSAEPLSYVATEPCRLMNTRPGDNQVGPRTSPLPGGSPITVVARGAQGNCDATQLPTDAVALQLNITPVNATASTDITIWPSGTIPQASTVNPRPGPPVPNAATVTLADDGTFQMQNKFGTIDMVIDVLGHYIPAGAAGTGPQGPAGPTGPQGDPGENAMELDNVVTVSASGGDFTDPAAAAASITDASQANPYTIVVGPGVYPLSSQLVLPSDVHLRGSGRGVTTIFGTFTSSFGTATGAVVVVDDDTEVSDLTILNVGANGAPSSAIFGDGATSVAINRVDAQVGSNAANGSAAIYVANGTFDITESSASADDSSDSFAVYALNSGKAVVSDSWVESNLGPIVGGVSDVLCDFVINGPTYEPGTVLGATCS